MNKEQWVVEVYAGNQYVGKMTLPNSKEVETFDHREQAITEAQKLKAKGTIGIWCKVVPHKEERNASSY
ncbi:MULTISPECIES: hypothetical protein [Bacillus]|uniref:hypothetical protein n=1 Tax=Bacillus TaxID=1386 RepID=UPI0006AE596F|nr:MULTISPECIES: hypothetical protein [Bacillus]AWD87933.1 hypothetical protein BVQ_10880 [Bacillus velezensis]KAF6690688.1 hypothetical protein G9362_16730 [Bacillus sp. EKM601B]KOS49120.1 hypothetical protein AN272_20065 [Bacillus amyloliquefaciens]MBA9149731.1 hypothetical protein [Bacillus sp. EKM213B]MDZ7434226.1 hypothetical protein [Bacillus amyloliquefaciens]